MLGAHPDDAEFHAGGLIVEHCLRGSQVRLVSVTDGGAGHHFRRPHELVAIRREEARQSGQVVNAEYLTWEFPDGRLQPTLEVRERIIREIRTFQPDLVLTHRLNDYHPDHRAVAQAVQDASYLVTVPLVVSDVPVLRQDPVVAYLPDLFTRPCPLRPDFILNIEPHLPTILRMLACHQSQVFEFLPYNQQIEGQVPNEPEARMVWLRQWYTGLIQPRAKAFQQMLPGDQAAPWIEAFEISEYAGRLTPDQSQRLFPGCQMLP